MRDELTLVLKVKTGRKMIVGRLKMSHGNSDTVARGLQCFVCGMFFFMAKIGQPQGQVDVFGR